MNMPVESLAKRPRGFNQKLKAGKTANYASRHEAAKSTNLKNGKIIAGTGFKSAPA
jgi:hypothetical protein